MSFRPSLSARVRLVLLACLAFQSLESCKPSAAEITERAEQADAEERARAHAANQERAAQASAKASADAVRQARAANANSASGGCGITAERAIKRMKDCGVNVEGFTPEAMCNKMGQPKVLYIASRECAELESILLGK